MPEDCDDLSPWLLWELDLPELLDWVLPSVVAGSLALFWVCIQTGM
jgi:hypothetical protein